MHPCPCRCADIGAGARLAASRGPASPAALRGHFPPTCYPTRGRRPIRHNDRPRGSGRPPQPPAVRVLAVKLLAAAGRPGQKPGRALLPCGIPLLGGNMRRGGLDDHDGLDHACVGRLTWNIRIRTQVHATVSDFRGRFRGGSRGPGGLPQSQARPGKRGTAAIDLRLDY